ncbi:hypothetical protein [Burkholderia sp. PU8-34]
MLRMPEKALEHTHIADHALVILRRRGIREVDVLGRRGHPMGASRNPEIEGLEHLDGVGVRVEGVSLSGEGDGIREHPDWGVRGNVATWGRLASRRPGSLSNKRVVRCFRASPVELRGNGNVEQIVVVRNHLTRDVGDFCAELGAEPRVACSSCAG